MLLISVRQLAAWRDFASHRAWELSAIQGRFTMKWTSMYLIGFIVLIGGVLAALWKMGVLESIGTTWTVIGIVMVIGVGIMLSVSHSGIKENIEIDRK